MPLGVGAINTLINAEKCAPVPPVSERLPGATGEHRASDYAAGSVGRCSDWRLDRVSKINRTMSRPFRETRAPGAGIVNNPEIRLLRPVAHQRSARDCCGHGPNLEWPDHVNRRACVALRSVRTTVGDLPLNTEFVGGRATDQPVSGAIFLRVSRYERLVVVWAHPAPPARIGLALHARRIGSRSRSKTVRNTRTLVCRRRPINRSGIANRASCS